MQHLRAALSLTRDFKAFVMSWIRLLVFLGLIRPCMSFNLFSDGFLTSGKSTLFPYLESFSVSVVPRLTSVFDSGFLNQHFDVGKLFGLTSASFLVFFCLWCSPLWLTAVTRSCGDILESVTHSCGGIVERVVKFFYPPAVSRVRHYHLMRRVRRRSGLKPLI